LSNVKSSAMIPRHPSVPNLISCAMVKRTKASSFRSQVLSSSKTGIETPNPASKIEARN
jgi:hypothetical protein